MSETAKTIKLSRRDVIRVIVDAAEKAYHEELMRQIRRHFPTEEITIVGATIELIKPSFPNFEIQGNPVQWVSE